MEPSDIAGTQCSLTAKMITATVATRNSGTATTAMVLTTSARSSSEPRFIAAVMPIISATGTETRVVVAASWKVAGIRCATSWVTGRLLANDVPKSP
ncbi:Uncharacterised protein [Klebsiella pneumoniae]|nr:Uncharacterised protein [Klebsiella pneumoniae]